jgi:hypothetical protein
MMAPITDETTALNREAAQRETLHGSGEPQTRLRGFGKVPNPADFALHHAVVPRS